MNDAPEFIDNRDGCMVAVAYRGGASNAAQSV